MEKLRTLMGGCCVYCGSTKQLQMHHKVAADKSFNISREFDRPWKELLLEVKKCELVCIKCHKEKHAPHHGLGMYSNQKCRCLICKTVWNLKTKEYKLKRKNIKTKTLSQHLKTV